VAGTSRDTVLNWIAMTCALENVPHRRGSVNHRIVAENASSRGPLTFRGRKRSAVCMHEQYWLS
jgi:hypothetical protein